MLQSDPIDTTNTEEAVEDVLADAMEHEAHAVRLARIDELNNFLKAWKQEDAAWEFGSLESYVEYRLANLQQPNTQERKGVQDE